MAVEYHAADAPRRKRRRHSGSCYARQVMPGVVGTVEEAGGVRCVGGVVGSGVTGEAWLR